MGQIWLVYVFIIKQISALWNKSNPTCFAMPQSLFRYVVYVFLSIWSLNFLFNKIPWSSDVLINEQTCVYKKFS